jgi:hypothetical protein
MTKPTASALRSFDSFAAFVTDYKEHLTVSHNEMRAKCSEEDVAGYRRMLARLSIKWLVEARDMEALAEVRDTCTAVLSGHNVTLIQ